MEPITLEISKPIEPEISNGFPDLNIELSLSRPEIDKSGMVVVLKPQESTQFKKTYRGIHTVKKVSTDVFTSVGVVHSCANFDFTEHESACIVWTVTNYTDEPVTVWGCQFEIEQ